MGTYDKAKTFANRFFVMIELNSINFAVKKLHRWRVRYKYSMKDDTIDPSYKNEAMKYWFKYTREFKPYFHEYYSSRNGICDVRYIPDDLYYTKIDQHFNNRKYGWGVNDKNYYSLWFQKAKQPLAVVHKINNIFYNHDYRLISVEEALEECNKYDNLIIKPAVETGGSKGIAFWNKEDTREALAKILFGKQSFPNLIVQQLIVQHETLSKIHSSSINTVRTISLIFEGQVHILSSVLRMGVNGSRVDNASAGGITCGIKEDGQLKDVAYSAHGIKYEKHPQGANFSEYKVPSYNKILDMVKMQHEKMAHFRLISWDIAVDKEGEPVLIEANLRNGELDFHQFNNGPLFGELTENVLEEVFLKQNTK